METIFAPTLADAFARAGMHLNGKEPEPGRLLRFATGKSDSDRAGWVRKFPDGDGAVFGCWRAGESYAWQRRDPTAPPPSETERAAACAKAEAARIEAEKERQEQHAKAAEAAAKIWAECAKAGDSHAYLARKGIRPHGVKLDGFGRLVLPVLNAEGKIQSLQFIDPDGDKRFYTGAEMKGGRLALGRPADGSPIVLTEGFATAASIREASGLVVVAGYSGSNLRHVAETLRRQYPRSPLIAAGDLDKAGQGRRYAEAVLAVSAPSVAVYPAFRDGRESGDFNDLHQTEGLEAVKNQIDAALMPSRFKLMSADDLAQLPPLSWRVRGVLPDAGLAAMFGPSGCGKSFLVIDLAQAVAAGLPWFGHRVKSCPVTYCALEGEAGIAGRVAAHRAKHGDFGGSLLYLLQPFNLLNGSDVAELSAAIQAAGGSAGVVILDTLNRAAPGSDENDSKDMGAIIAAAKSLQSQVGGLVLLIHHTGKDASKGLRGHSSLHAALDAAIEVRRDNDRREWKLHKSKDGDDSIAHPFRLEVVEVGKDEDGEPLTSCVVLAEEATGEALRRALPPKSGNQKIIWDALGEELRKSSSFAEAGAPPGRPCIRLEDAIEKTRGLLICEAKRQTERARDALKGLIARGLLQHREGWLWCS